jgi:superfamily II DNA or RNA helicase
MDFVENTLNSFQFVYFGVYIDAFINSDGELKKRALLPNGWDSIEDVYMGTVWDKNYGIARKPNAVAINTELSDITTIDVDKPNECEILDDLLKECKFYVKTKKGYHFYFKKDDEIPRRKMCGVADINTHLLYLCPEYQQFKFNNMVDNEYTNKKTGKVVKTKKYVGYELIGDKYKYEIIKSRKLVKMSDKIKQWCMKLINDETNNIVKKDKKQQKERILINPNVENRIFDLEQMAAIYDIFYESKLFDKYDSWRDIAYISRHLNNSEECFKLFDKYSRKIVKYKNADELDNRIVFYQNNEYEENFEYSGVLYKCKKLNKGMFADCLNKLYVKKELDSIKINTQYIYINENNKYFDNWMKNYKCMMIKSAYGTGKTRAFREIIDKYDPKKILFITYRQSLAWSLLEELKGKYNFESYQNREEFDIKSQERLIIQLDSLHLLRGVVNMITNKTSYPSYDLVVLDETEGLLNHLSFPKLSQLLIEHTLSNILTRAGKILCLDGDLADRSVDYIDHYFKNDYFILENMYKTNKKNFAFTNNKSIFDEKVETALKKGEKIVIVSMSSKECEIIKERYEKKYNVLIHNGIQKNKKKLMDVNKEWAKVDILTYSPVVEAGVDFTDIHFDRCFGILSSQSTSYRAYLQMLGRVRNYKYNDICVYTGSIPFKEYDTIFTYNDVEAELYNDIEKSALIKTLIHNKVEENNTNTYFMPSLLQLLRDKGHTYTYEETKRQKKDDDNDEYNKKKLIFEARDIDNDELNRIIQDERQNKDNRDNYFAKEKALYKKRWAIEDLTEEYFDKIYNKTNVLHNYLLTKLEKDDRGLDKYDYLKKVKFQKIDIIMDLMTNIDGEINYDNINKVVNSKRFKVLFSNSKKVKNITTAAGINGIINNYGYKVESKRKNNKIDGKVKTTYTYSVQNLDIIDDYIKRINNEGDIFVMENDD